MKILCDFRFLFLAGFILLFSGFVNADEEKAIQQSIETLFEGMYTGDSAMVHSVFYDGVRMYSSFQTAEGQAELREGSLASFLKAVGTPHDTVWDEKIWDLKISVDDNLAHAWMNYAFYAGDQFSHCGVNAMQLVKMDGSWKIVHLIDTRRKENCAIPERLQK